MSFSILLDHADVILGGRAVLTDVTFRLHTGGHVAVLGENGAGKSTFLKLLRGDIWPAPGRGRRRYIVDGATSESPIAFKPRAALMGAETQDRYRRLDPALSAREVIASGFGDVLYRQGELGAAEAEAVELLAAELGVTGLLPRTIGELSEGEMRRVLLARALAPRPLALFCDECAEGLDKASRVAFTDCLLRAAARGATLVIAAHRAEDVPACVTGRVRMDAGRLIEPPASLAEAPGCGFVPGDAPAAPAGIPLPEPPFMPVSFPVHAVQPGEVEPCTLVPPHPIVALSGVTVLRAGREALTNVSLTVRAGEHLAVVGRNGAGKSTLLAVITAELRPSDGVVEWFGKKREPDVWTIRRRIALVPSDLGSRWPAGHTLREAVVSGFYASVGLYVDPGEEEWDRADAILEFLGLTALAEREVLTLSTGQKRLAAIGRALTPNPELLLLDEPFAGLDAKNRARIRTALDHLAQTGVTLVVVSHRDKDMPTAVKRVVTLERGRLAEG